MEEVGVLTDGKISELGVDRRDFKAVGVSCYENLRIRE